MQAHIIRPPLELYNTCLEKTINANFIMRQETKQRKTDTFLDGETTLISGYVAGLAPKQSAINKLAPKPSNLLKLL